MIWINRLILYIPLAVTILVLAWLVLKTIAKKKISRRTYLKLILLIIGVYILKLAAWAIFKYWQLAHDPFGQYLLPGKGSKYYEQMLWFISQPYVIALAIAIGLVVFANLVTRLTKRPLFEHDDFYVIFLTTFVVGYPNIFVLIVGSGILMIFFQIGAVLRSRGKSLQEFRVSFAPFLLVSALIIIILANFSFYNQFLGYLRLI